MNSIQSNIDKILKEIEFLSEKFNNNKSLVKLLCVSKTKPVEDIIVAYQTGARDFGESYINEACSKIDIIKEQGFNDINWHFIGPIQTNKAKYIANYFNLVESVDREKAARFLNEKRDPSLGPLDILVQVNISHESQKSGVDIKDLDNLINYIKGLKNLKLRGLMGIALETDDKALIKQEFKLLKSLFDKYQDTIADFNILSMGMTHDMDLAIECGSTEIRIGTAIFGPRNYNR